MDAESRKRRRESSISLRQQRWSMSSHRVEQIVAELMVPVKDAGKSFDRDLNGLLEDYLTQQGLRALACVEAGGEPPQPNYAELAMILAVSAANWGKKVDCLYDMVVSYEQRLNTDSARASEGDGDGDGEGEGGEGASGRRRRDTGGAADGFAAIALAASGAARRDSAPPGPPPTLPRIYTELEPRAPADDERALRDYQGEVIGMLPDFHVAWRLHDGLLVDELESTSPDGAALRPLSLVELQEACSRGAPPAPAAPSSTPSSPLPLPPTSPPPSPDRMPPPPAACKRKRKSTVQLEQMLTVANVDLDLSADVLERLSEGQEFKLSSRWIRRVVGARAAAIRHARTSLPPPVLEFRGFDSPWTDIGGFRGWRAEEGAAARATAGLAARRLAAELGGDDDDDGFCEGRSLSGPRHQDEDEGEGAAAEEWQLGVVRRAAEAEPMDLRECERRVARALPAPPAALSWARLCAGCTRPAPAPGVARCFLAVLMQVNRGEMEIIQGAPLTPGDFSVRALNKERASSGLGDDDYLDQEPDPPPPPHPAPARDRL